MSIKLRRNIKLTLHLREAVRLYLLLMAILALGVLSVSAQNPANYTGIKSAGTIPAGFLGLTYLKIEKDIEKDKNSSDTRLERRTKKVFHENSAYGLKSLFASGRTCFGDPVTAYLNRIKDELLKDDTKIKDNIAVYLFKSSKINAFCTNSGAIFVTTNLIANTGSEAELAFILSHEIIHYVKQHGINQRLDAANKSKSKPLKTFKQVEAHFKMLSERSQDDEYEADSLGFLLFKKSKFNLMGAKGSMEMLKDSRDHAHEVKFDSLFFNKLSTPLPLHVAILADTTNNLTDSLEINDTSKVVFSFNITPLEDVEEEESKSKRKKKKKEKITAEELANLKFESHPDIDKRIARLAKMIDRSKKSTDTKYSFDMTAYLKSKLDCHIETTMLLIDNAYYQDALIELKRLETAYGEHAVFDKIQARALYEFAYTEQRIGSHDYYVFPNTINLQLHTLTDADLKSLAYIYVSNIADKMKSDAYLNLIRSELLTSVLEIQLDMASEVAVKDATINPVDTSSWTYKFLLEARIKKDSYIIMRDTNYLDAEAYALTPFDPSYKEIAKLFEGDYKALKDSLYEVSWSQSKIEKRGLNEKKIIIYNPVWVNLKVRKKYTLYEREVSEIKQNELVTKLQKSAHDVGIKTEVISNALFKSSDIEKYNEDAALKKWFHWTEATKRLKIVYYYQDELDRICTKYGESKILFAGVVRWRAPLQYQRAPIYAACLFFFPLAPIAIRGMLESRFLTEFYVDIVDMQDGQFTYGKAVLRYRRPINHLLTIMTRNLFRMVKRNNPEPKE